MPMPMPMPIMPMPMPMPMLMPMLMLMLMPMSPDTCPMPAPLTLPHAPWCMPSAGAGTRGRSSHLPLAVTHDDVHIIVIRAASNKN